MLREVDSRAGNGVLEELAASPLHLPVPWGLRDWCNSPSAVCGGFLTAYRFVAFYSCQLNSFASESETTVDAPCFWVPKTGEAYAFVP